MKLPRLATVPQQDAAYGAFLRALSDAGFSGDIATDFGSRTVLATDNSIYQWRPQAVVYPRATADLVILGQQLARPEHRAIKVAARGGGTGTNGQSLTDGLVVDLSRHMNAILAIDPERRTARVQSGVVKDQLNAALKVHGLFFAPELSTSNRATIGGMINTDASGQGSCLYGKTRDHVIELTTVLANGEVITTRPIADHAVNDEFSGRGAEVHTLAAEIFDQHRSAIDEKFPKLNRCLTGYDLAHIRDADGRLNLNNLICGSEGTLGFVVEATLNVLPIPSLACLAVVHYGDFDSALRDASRLMGARPSSIETVDSKVLTLARGDNTWREVAEFFPEDSSAIAGVNLVEYTADSEADLEAGLTRLTAILESEPNPACLGYRVARGHGAVNRVWGMRKRAVGLLGNSQGEARPIPFVEDTAVPPECLADFISEFRALLDGEGLSYGMFGHVDAGVLHVRPALDLKNPAELARVRAITDRVAELTHKYGGLLWGEHGKGVRSEYAPKFFGELYPQLQRIKAAFDPFNQLNPGKIATPAAALELLKIDAVPLRGEADREIAPSTWQRYGEAVYCNGNGACFNWDTADAMCPSYKVTRERIHSPKGRASLMREWLRQLADTGFDAAAPRAAESPLAHIARTPLRLLASLQARRGAYDFSHEVHTAMAGCLACKSCAGQCPIKVDVPTFRSQFLHIYHSRYARPLKDYLVAGLEYMLPVAARLPAAYNALMSAAPVRTLLARRLGFVDAPPLPRKSLAHYGLQVAHPDTFDYLPEARRQRAVVLVQDAFTSYYEPETVKQVADLLQTLGFEPWLAPYRANGKPAHVHGFLGHFAWVAERQVRLLRKLSARGVPLVGIDPAMTLTYRAEYRKAVAGPLPEVMLLQEFLASRPEILAQALPRFASGGEFHLFPHCTERTIASASIGQWQQVFAALGQRLHIVKTGCCGMSGTYGHEARHRENATKLFAMSWQKPLSELGEQSCASGYSCRSQCKRETGQTPRHPAAMLLARITPAAAHA